MDLGNSLNPAIDIGQIEGGFIMALGYMLCEEVLYLPSAENSFPSLSEDRNQRHAKGQVQINLGTWTYKPPSGYDIPEVLNVTLGTPTQALRQFSAQRPVLSRPWLWLALLFLQLKNVFMMRENHFTD